MSVAGILLQAAALFPTTEASASFLSHNRNAYTEQVSFSLDFKSAVSKDWLSLLQRSMLSLHTHKTNFPGVTTRMECLKHWLSSSALILRSELSAPTDLLFKKAQALVGNAVS